MPETFMDCMKDACIRSFKADFGIMVTSWDEDLDQLPQADAVWRAYKAAFIAGMQYQIELGKAKFADANVDIHAASVIANANWLPDGP